MTLTSRFNSFDADATVPNQAASADVIRAQIRQWMRQCRQSTLTLFDGMDRATFCGQAHSDFSPVGWHLGHIAFTEALWILEQCAAQPPRFSHYRQLLAADGLPKAERQNLPTLAEIQAYATAIRSDVFAYLDTAPIANQERIWKWLLQHESQHCETIAMVLALHQPYSKENDSVSQGTLAVHLPLTTEMIHIPAGEFELGHDGIEAIDNERPVHRIYLDAYWIDAMPVSCRQYRQFMQADGYQNPEWWSADGWQWLQSHPVTQPRYWRNEPTYDHHPVCGVSWYEAEAYANFVGKRLPTEAEWEKAACWQPETQRKLTYPWGDEHPESDYCNHGHHVGWTSAIAAYPLGKSPYGCWDMLGNVWEWTASWFIGYPGFKAYPYRGYSQVYFDQAHRVLRGGSWATRSWAMRGAFRNWYHPHVREVFAGFRCVRSGP